MTRKPRVYVVQMPATRQRGEWVPKYDLSAAEAFGELVYTLPPGNVPSDHAATNEALSRALFGACSAADRFDPDADYLLLLGDPVAIARAVLVIARTLPRDGLRALKWDRRAGAYEPYRVG